MDASKFVTIAENIHCTLIVKLDGKRVEEMPDGLKVVTFQHGGQKKLLPISPDWKSPMLDQGKVQHIALAIWHALNSDGPEKELGEEYLIAAAEAQIAGGANFLDVNVDEYSNDDGERAEVMTWLAGFLSERFDVPLSIDSSNAAVLRAGLEACPKGRTPMVNSVSLERADCVGLVAEFSAEAVVSAAGKEELPCDVDDRLANFREIIKLLEDAGVPRKNMHLDPLVFPISTDPQNGRRFLDATQAAKNEFGEVHLTGGFSNISFGMPNRKLLNMTFVHLAAEHGADSGIINPVTMPAAKIAAMDTQAEPYQLARAVLTGEDAYGMEFITAAREGKLK